MMQLKQSEIDKFLTEFKRECYRFRVGLNITSSHYLGSHYYQNKIVLDRSQIEDYIESSNADPLEVWRVVAYHELTHHRGYITEESCWNSLEKRSDLHQETVTVLRSQATWGSASSVKGRNWDRVRVSLNSKPVMEFIRLNQLSAVTREAIELQTPGLCWHFVKTKYQDSCNLEEIVKPLLINSNGHLMELCYSRQYDCLESELAGLCLWRQIKPLL